MYPFSTVSGLIWADYSRKKLPSQRKMIGSGDLGSLAPPVRLAVEVGVLRALESKKVGP